MVFASISQAGEDCTFIASMSIETILFSKLRERAVFLCLNGDLGLDFLFLLPFKGLQSLHGGINLQKIQSEIYNKMYPQTTKWMEKFDKTLKHANFILKRSQTQLNSKAENYSVNNPTQWTCYILVTSKDMHDVIQNNLLSCLTNLVNTVDCNALRLKLLCKIYFALYLEN